MSLIVIILFILLAILAGKYASHVTFKYILFAVIGFFVFVWTFISPLNSVSLLVFSMLLSPEISVASIQSRQVVVRYDDIILILMFISWFTRSAIVKREPFLFKTPIQIPLLLYTVIYFLSTFLGVLRGDIIWTKAIFYVLKYFEYYLMYFMVVNILKDQKDLSKYLKYGLIVLIVVVIYSYVYYFNSTGVMVRTTAPFEAPLGSPEDSEPASLGGYYLLVFGILFGLISEVRGSKFFFILVLILSIYPSFLLTFSRASYMGFMVLIISFIFLVRKRKGMFIIVSFFVLAFSFLQPGISEKVKKRIENTYRGKEARNIVHTPFGDIKLEESAYLRYKSLQNVILNVFPEYPLLGKGVTGIGLGDNQYSLIIGETGIIGFIMFIWLIYSVITMSYKVYIKSDDLYMRSVALGVVCATMAYLVQGFGVNTFIIVRIMEPYWFCVALVSLSYLRIKSREVNGI